MEQNRKVPPFHLYILPSTIITLIHHPHHHHIISEFGFRDSESRVLIWVWVTAERPHLVVLPAGGGVFIQWMRNVGIGEKRDQGKGSRRASLPWFHGTTCRPSNIIINIKSPNNAHTNPLSQKKTGGDRYPEFLFSPLSLSLSFLPDQNHLSHRGGNLSGFLSTNPELLNKTFF